MKLKLLILLLCFASGANAQVELTRQVIGAAGGNFNIGPTSISATIGEPIVATVSADSTTLTQGFHQPGFMGFLEFGIETVDASCPTATDGTAVISGLVGCRGPYNILWSNGATTTTAEDLGPGLYSVTVSTGQCALSQTFEISSGPEADCAIRFFNAFSPNDDGTNDTWEIENIESPAFSDNKVEIFNRWGQLIWIGENYDNHDVVWKGGQNNGGKLPDATYFYIATVNDKVYKGFIELTR